MAKDFKTRRYTFTIHNYTQKDLKRFIVLAESLDKHRYILFGLELAPETGTPHIQGYVELNEAQRLTFLHNYFHFTRNKKLIKFHIERANGSAKDNKEYCSKDGKFYEFGEPQVQGQRTDLLEIKEAVRSEPKRLNEIVDEQCNNFQQVKFAETIQPYYLVHRDPDLPPLVYWIFGETEVGKTSLVYKTFDADEVCSVSDYKWLGTGYKQQTCFLLDDFREGNLPFETILKIADRYPFTLERKGGHVPLHSPFIIFTSPKSVSRTFLRTDEDIKQLKRRVIQINLNTIHNVDEVDLLNLNDKFIFTDDDYSHQDF